MRKGYTRSELKRKKQFDKKRKKGNSKAKIARIAKLTGKYRLKKIKVKVDKIMEKQKQTRKIYKHKRFIFNWLYPRKLAFEYYNDKKLWILGCYFFVIGINLKSKYDV